MQITTFLYINIFLCRHLVIWGQLSKKNMSKKSYFVLEKEKRQSLALF